jgi:integrase
MFRGMSGATVTQDTRKRWTRGHVEELPSGSFRAVVYAGLDPLTRRPPYLRDRDTAKDYEGTQVALTQLQHQVNEDRHPKSAITVGQAIAQWLEFTDLEDTTRDPTRT